MLSNILSKIDNDTSPQKSNIEVSVSIEIERDINDDEIDTVLPKMKRRKIYSQCLLPEHIMKEETLKLMESTTTIPDKVIEIEIRNNWGKYVQPNDEQTDELESVIQTAVYNFKQWNYQSRVRESILAYKCYICNIGWWELTPFKDHIRQHKDVKVDIEPFHHECCIVAFYGEQDSSREVLINGLCHHCLRTSSEHEVMKHQCMYYFCEGCRGRYFTCAAIFKHEGTCGRFQKILLQDNILNDTSVCQICKINCLTQNRYEQHINLRHSVRSDDPVTYFWPTSRLCAKCDYKFFLFNVHICPKKFENLRCKHCYRRFQQRWQLDIHLATNNCIINCRVCWKGIKRCNETEHMLKHSKNYIMAYKCQRCDTNIMFLDEYSARKHCEFTHSLRWESKPKGFHLVSIFFSF